MTNEEIVSAALNLETTRDLLNLLNEIKMDELGEKGHPFLMPHFNYFIHPSRNKKSYKSFRIPKKSGGYRTISAPKDLLKSFLTYINRLLQAFYNAPSYVTGFVPDKSVVDNAEIHVGKNYVFNTDIKDFFPSISKSRVWATLKLPPFSFNDTIADAIAGICCTELSVNGEMRWALPQGSPCSPILTNIVCRNLDHKLYKLAKQYNLRYSRYADDITFSSNRNVFQKGGKFQNDLASIISGQHFTINQQKTRLQKKFRRQEVTGLIVSDRVSVPREYIREIDNVLYIWEKYGEADAFAKFLSHYTPKHQNHIHKPNMRAIIQGKLQYLKMVKGADSELWRRLQRRFNSLIEHNDLSVSATIKYKYIISDFEQLIGSKLVFTTNSWGVEMCSFVSNGKNTPVMLSKYARTRINNILAKNDQALVDKFKSNYLLIFYEKGNNSFWRIERKRSNSSVVFSIDLNDPSLCYGIGGNATQTDSNNYSSQMTEKSTDAVLASLITSNFDLSILDEWDRTKNS